MSLSNDIPKSLIEAAIANPGQTVGLSSGGAPTTSNAPTSVDITNTQQKGIRPNIPGNELHDVTRGRISRPSAGLAQRLADGDAKLRAEAAAQAEQHRAQLAVVDPSKLNDRIAYLERALKRAEKNIRELKAEVKGDASKE